MLLGVIGFFALTLDQSQVQSTNGPISQPAFAASLCETVSYAATEGERRPGAQYVHRTMIYRAAGVTSADRPEAVREKIQRFWNRHQHELHCNRQMPTADSHILKLLAGHTSAMEFLREAVTIWRVDLNHVDRSGRTVLDFIEEELAGAAGRSFISEPFGNGFSPEFRAFRTGQLREYRAMLEAHGARRVRDLPPAARAPRGPAHEMVPYGSRQVNGAWFTADLCGLVATQNSDGSRPDGTGYSYRTRMFLSGGVDPQADSREVIRQKMQAWWSRYQHLLHCNLLNSSGPKHILKLAVERGSGEFINDVARRWQVDLNHLSNGGTVLDYIDAEMIRARGTPREAIFAEYQGILERRGARRARELRR